MVETDLSKIIRQGAESLCFFFCAIMSTVYVFYLSQGYNKAGTDKGILYLFLGGFFFALGLLVSIVYIGSNIKNLEIKQAISKLSISDKFILAYLLILLISFLISPNNETKLLGVGGWYQGFLPSLFMIGSYFIISRFMGKAKLSLAFLCGASAIEGIVVIANRFGIYPPNFPGRNPSYAGTMGNVNWYCGYWSVFFPLTMGLYLLIPKENKVLRILAGICLSISSLAGIIQGSDSALIVFLLVLTTSLLIFYKGNKAEKIRYTSSLILVSAPAAALTILLDVIHYKMEYDAQIITLLLYSPASIILFVSATLLFLVVKVADDRASTELLVVIKTVFVILWPLVILAYIVLLIINTLSFGSIGPLSDNSLFYADLNWGNYRGYTMYAGVGIFKDADIWHKLFGWGPDSFCYAVYQGGSSVSEKVISKFGDVRLTNAHCEPITLLANVGVLGLISFTGFQVSKIAELLKKKTVISIACALSLMGYLANNLVSFAQPMNITFLFIIIGIGSMYNKEEVLTKEEA